MIKLLVNRDNIYYLYGIYGGFTIVILFGFMKSIEMLTYIYIYNIMG